MKSIRITSDGTRGGSRVVDAETGEEIQGVTKVTWTLDAPSGSPARAIIEVIGVEIDAAAEVAIVDDDLFARFVRARRAS